MNKLPSFQDFEFSLLREFEKLVVDAEKEVKDAMHYVLFSRKNRSGISVAFQLLPSLGISHEQFIGPALALETMRRALAFTCAKFQSMKPTPRDSVEPSLSSTAAFSLLPFSFQLFYQNSEQSLSLEKRDAIAKILTQTVSPAGWLSSLLRQMTILKTGRENEITPKELRHLHEQSATLVYSAVGTILEILTPTSLSLPKNFLKDWFQKYGLFLYWSEDIEKGSSSPGLSILTAFPTAEAFDLLMSLEAELIDNAAKLDMALNQPIGLAEQAIFPISRMLKAKLQ